MQLSMFSKSAAAPCMVLLAHLHAVVGDSFLKHDPRPAHLRAGVDADAEFRNALEAVAGCGPRAATEASNGLGNVTEVQRALAPMWRALPKHGEERVEWRMVRYIAHRYFMQRSHLLVRGLEPILQVNDSHLGVAGILASKAPPFVEKLLHSKTSSSGFSLEDASALVAALERLVNDAEGTLLRTVYHQAGRHPGKQLGHKEFVKIVEAYMVNWMMGEDQEFVMAIRTNNSIMDEAVPHWQGIRAMLDGLVRGLAFARQRGGAPKPGHGAVAMEQRYGFADAHEVVGRITKTFGSYWESECQNIKRSLVALDTAGTGRVRLADFYGANSDGDWRFGESAAYLRELGALDETSAWHGKQVIISNYIQGASNCVVTTPHYFVCCANECEGILNEIEDAIGASVASPEDILRPLASMSSFEDEAPKITHALKTQLSRIAETHGGMVPLHGRLFSQWLHYVFPRECPFPHKAGAHTTQSPTSYGDDFAASRDEVAAHAAERTVGDLESAARVQAREQEEAQWMSQWSEEEELLADYSAQLRAPWEARGSGVLAAAALAAAGLLLGISTLTGRGKGHTSAGAWDTPGKSHFV